MFCMRNTLDAKIPIALQCKNKKEGCAKSNQIRVSVAIQISNKIDFEINLLLETAKDI